MPLFLFGCEAECCLRQMQRGGARAKQRETKQSAGFDCVLPMEQEKKRRKKRNLRKIREIGILPISLVVFPYCHPSPRCHPLPPLSSWGSSARKTPRCGVFSEIGRSPRGGEGSLNGAGSQESLHARGIGPAVNQSPARSAHVGFLLSISSFFLARRQPLSCFSRAMAYRTSEKLS